MIEALWFDQSKTNLLFFFKHKDIHVWIEMPDSNYLKFNMIMINKVIGSAGYYGHRIRLENQG